jgi:hypothetical protein
MHLAKEPKRADDERDERKIAEEKEKTSAPFSRACEHQIRSWREQDNGHTRQKGIFAKFSERN